MTRTFEKHDLVDRIENLPPLPTVVSRILTLTGSDNASATDVAKVLREDPAIAAKLLRVANSSYYGAARQISQVSRAVVLIGCSGVRNIVMGLAARKIFPPSEVHLDEYTKLWEHSIATAVAAESIALHLDYKPSEEAFVAGLLHDIGQLAMATYAPVEFHEVCRGGTTYVAIPALEGPRFGMNHAEIGLEILTRWGLPEEICLVAGLHHSRKSPDSPEAATLVEIVKMADLLAQMMGYGLDLRVDGGIAQERTERLGQLGDTVLLNTMRRLNRRVEKAIVMFRDAEEVEFDAEPDTTPSALWVQQDPDEASSLGKLLIEYCGYTLIDATADELPAAREGGELVIVVPSEDRETDEIVRLAEEGSHQVVVLSDDILADEPRRRDPETGTCYLPRCPTLHDIRWMEENLSDE